MAKACPLCGSFNHDIFFSEKKRQYRRCFVCALVFVPPEFFLSREHEKAVYDLHENSPDDAGYRQFLSRLVTPLLSRLVPAARGLDFGCGPGPTLSIMLKEAGYPVALYDIFYQPDRQVLRQSYRFITATEVLEHLHQPGSVIDELWSLIEAGGCLAVMTKLVTSAENFSRWHYKNDPTHVVFFSKITFFWLAQKLNARLEFYGADVVFLIKPE